MRYTFGEFELDLPGREVRRAGERVAMQPQVFALLRHLVENRGRVVGKDELLEVISPGAQVTDGSLQRVVSLLRSSLRPELVRTYPKQGYRFVAQVGDVDRGSERPRWARSGEVHVAWRAQGDGPSDVVLVTGWAFTMEAAATHPGPRERIAALARLARVITFDKRGTGASDRVKHLPSIEQRMDDLRSVLDAAASRRAIVVGMSEGGPLAALFAAAHPERTRALVLVGSFARMTAAPDYPWGWSPEQVQALRRYTGTRWGAGETLRAIVPPELQDPPTLAWCARSEQIGASPGAALDLTEMNLQIDVRAILPTVHVPTIVLHRREDATIHPGNGRFLAGAIPGAEYHEVAGADHAFIFQGTELVDAVRGILGREDPAGASFLGAVVAVPAMRGDLDPVLRRHGAVRIADLPAAYLDGPARAIACAQELAASLHTGAGVHCGELTGTGGSVRGEVTELARRLAAAARPGEVRVSRVVVDLAPGAGIAFTALDGDPPAWSVRRKS